MIKLEDNIIQIENSNIGSNDNYVTTDELNKVLSEVGADINNIISMIGNYALSNIFNEDMKQILVTIEELRNKAENIPTIQKKIDMSQGININGSSFTELPQVFDFSKVEDIGSKLQNLPKLEKVEYLDTSSAISFEDLFFNCPRLREINKLECGNLEDGFDLTNVTLTNVGGFNNNKYSFSIKLNLDYNTKENIFNVTNYLYDFTENGITPQTGMGECNIYVNEDFFESTNQDIQYEIANTIYVGQRKGWFVNVQIY